MLALSRRRGCARGRECELLIPVISLYPAQMRVNSQTYTRWCDLRSAGSSPVLLLDLGGLINDFSQQKCLYMFYVFIRIDFADIIFSIWRVKCSWRSCKTHSCASCTSTVTWCWSQNWVQVSGLVCSLVTSRRVEWDVSGVFMPILHQNMACFTLQLNPEVWKRSVGQVRSKITLMLEKEAGVVTLTALSCTTVTTETSITFPWETLQK